MEVRGQAAAAAAVAICGETDLWIIASTRYKNGLIAAECSKCSAELQARAECSGYRCLSRSITAGGHVKWYDSYPGPGATVISTRGGGRTHPVSTEIVHHAGEGSVSTLRDRYILEWVKKVWLQSRHWNNKKETISTWHDTFLKSTSRTIYPSSFG